MSEFKNIEMFTSNPDHDYTFFQTTCECCGHGVAVNISIYKKDDGVLNPPSLLVSMKTPGHITSNFEKGFFKRFKRNIQIQFSKIKLIFKLLFKNEIELEEEIIFRSSDHAEQFAKAMLIGLKNSKKYNGEEYNGVDIELNENDNITTILKENEELKRINQELFETINNNYSNISTNRVIGRLR